MEETVQQFDHFFSQQNLINLSIRLIETIAQIAVTIIAFYGYSDYRVEQSLF